MTAPRTFLMFAYVLLCNVLYPVSCSAVAVCQLFNKPMIDRLIDCVGGGGERDGVVGGNDEEHAIVDGRGEGRTAQVIQTQYREVRQHGNTHFLLAPLELTCSNDKSSRLETKLTERESRMKLVRLRPR